nr:receptor-like protein kinase FERONIA [Ipomoea batatas]
MHYFLAFLLFHLFISGAGAGSPAYTPPDYFLLNCGASSSQQFQGRTWETDNFTTFIPPNAAHISLTFTGLEQGPSVPQVPYTTGVRIFPSQFTYSFPVSAGPKFLRLYFHAAHFPPAEFDLTKSFFSVVANEYTLLSNFSAYLTSVDSLVQKEYIVNVNDNQKLNITFTPSASSYAFVNGIEIVSIPTGYYIKGEAAGVDPVKWVPGANNFYIFNNTALETLYRLNIGGQTLPAINDTGMYRTWYSDDEYVIGYGYYTVHLDVNINYTSLTPSYSAPEIVYTSARTIANYSSSVNWSFPVDSGFLYLFRLYFCGSNIPIFQDYVVIVPDKDGRRSKQDVWFSISPNMDTRPAYANAILNGLEIFKLNDTQGSLAALNPQLSLLGEAILAAASSSKEKKPHRGGGCHCWWWDCGDYNLGNLDFPATENGKLHSKKSWDILPAVSAAVRMRGRLGSSSLSSHHHNFPLEDLKSATSDFDENLVIGKGGFGVVLFEALCARPAVDPTLTREKANLAEWGRKCCRKGMVDQMVDPRLRDEISPECLKSYAEIAYKCLMDEGVERPAMSDVICSLEFALQLQEKADGFQSASLSTSLHRDTELNTASEISSEGIFSFSDEVAPKL